MNQPLHSVEVKHPQNAVIHGELESVIIWLFQATAFYLVVFEVWFFFFMVLEAKVLECDTDILSSHRGFDRDMKTWGSMNIYRTRERAHYHYWFLLKMLQHLPSLDKDLKHN